jgi:glutathione S-transferase
MSNLAINTLSWCSTALFFKFFFTILIQGKQRFAAGSRPPEDIMIKSLARGTTQSFGMESTGIEEEKMKKYRMLDERWKRIVLNDLENIPIGLIIATISILSGGNQWVNSASLVVFTVSRIGHTISYAKELQPHRAICWGTAVSAVSIMALNGSISTLFQ